MFSFLDFTFIFLLNVILTRYNSFLASFALHCIIILIIIRIIIISYSHQWHVRERDRERDVIIIESRIMMYNTYYLYRIIIPLQSSPVDQLLTDNSKEGVLFSVVCVQVSSHLCFAIGYNSNNNLELHYNSGGWTKFQLDCALCSIHNFRPLCRFVCSPFLPVHYKAGFNLVLQPTRLTTNTWMQISWRSFETIVKRSTQRSWDMVNELNCTKLRILPGHTSDYRHPYVHFYLSLSLLLVGRYSLPSTSKLYSFPTTSVRLFLLKIICFKMIWHRTDEHFVCFMCICVGLKNTLVRCGGSVCLPHHHHFSFDWLTWIWFAFLSSSILVIRVNSNFVCTYLHNPPSPHSSTDCLVPKEFTENILDTYNFKKGHFEKVLGYNSATIHYNIHSTASLVD